MSEFEHIVGPDTPDGQREWTSYSRGNKTWHMRLSRALTDEERIATMVLRGDEHDDAWSETEGDYEMVKVLWCITQVAPDIEVAAWWHRPYYILVQGLYLPYKIYEMVGAMSEGDATEAARAKWKEQYGHHGIKATISKTRIATKKDLRKAQEIK